MKTFAPRFSHHAIVLLLTVCGLLMCQTQLWATAISGNPAADTWSFNGNSLNKNTYIRGGGTFSFDIYTNSFVVTAADTGLLAKGWSVGDTVVGLGGVIVPNDMTAAHTGWSTDGVTPVANSDNAVNVDLTTSVRIVSKFGVSPTSWSASTVKPNAGNGLGSGSAGDGGDGTIELTTNVNDIANGNAGVLVNPANAVKDTFNGVSWVSTNLSDRSFGLYEFQMSGTLLSSWEMMLNATKLGSLYPYANIPLPGDRLNQALQRSSNAVQFTDGLALAPAVPEPTSDLLILLGGIGLLNIRRLRKQ
jgi:hypothetical protein